MPKIRSNFEGNNQRFCGWRPHLTDETASFTETLDGNDDVTWVVPIRIEKGFLSGHSIFECSCFQHPGTEGLYKIGKKKLESRLEDEEPEEWTRRLILNNWCTELQKFFSSVHFSCSCLASSPILTYRVSYWLIWLIDWINIKSNFCTDAAFLGVLTKSDQRRFPETSIKTSIVFMAITAFVLFCLFSLPSFIAETWFRRCSVVLIGYHFVGEFRYGIFSLLEWIVFPMIGLMSNIGTAFIMIYARNKALFVFQKSWR